MKTNRIFIMALACVAAVSCAKDIDTPSLSVVTADSFTAQKEDFTTPTKAVLDGKKAVWEANDEIAVYADGAAAVKFTTESEGASVQFKSETEVKGSSFLLAYPYSAAKGVQDGKLQLTIPAEQTAVNGSFDPKAGLSAASATDLSQPVKFKNALALLKFNIPASLDGKVNGITVESKGVEALAGEIIFNVADKSNTPGADVSTSVTLAAEQMTQGYYYVAVRPAELASGIKVTAVTDESVYTRESGACEFLVNTIYDMGDVAADGWNETVAIEPSIVPSETSVNVLGGGYATEAKLTVESNVEWKAVVSDEYKEWLSAERDGDNLKIKVTQNNRLSNRTGFLTLTSVETVPGYEGVKVSILQPIVFNIKVANSEVDEITGNVKLPFCKDKIVTSYFKFAKGSLVVEFDEIHASDAARFGFNFYAEDGSQSNFSFYLDPEKEKDEEDNIIPESERIYKYMFRIGGGFGWSQTITKAPADYMDWSEIRKVEFICQDDPDNAGTLEVCLYINDDLYGKHSKRTNIFADGGDPQIYFHLQCKGNPAADDYCIVKSITYTPAE